MRYRVNVISAGRPASVLTMEPQVGPAYWYVPREEVGEYHQVGAHMVVGIVGGLSAARNAAMEDSWNAGAICIQTDDDLVGLKRMWNPKPVPLDFHAACRWMVFSGAATGAKLVGASPTGNPLNYRVPVQTHHTIIASLCAIFESEPRFRKDMSLKEDYDFTCQHIEAYGKVLRLEGILPNYRHYTNRGGAVARRTTEAEQRAIELLKARWPQAIFDHPRRPNEVVLRWPKEVAV